MGNTNDNHITIYIPADLKKRLAVLVPRSISKICQDALEDAVNVAEQRWHSAVDDLMMED